MLSTSRAASTPFHSTTSAHDSDVTGHSAHTMPPSSVQDLSCAYFCDAPRDVLTKMCAYPNGSGMHSNPRMARTDLTCNAHALPPSPCQPTRSAALSAPTAVHPFVRPLLSARITSGAQVPLFPCTLSSGSHHALPLGFEAGQVRRASNDSPVPSLPRQLLPSRHLGSWAAAPAPQSFRTINLHPGEIATPASNRALRSRAAAPGP